MVWLVIGVVVFAAVHLVPTVAPGVRARLAGVLGEGPYKGAFAAFLIAALVIIVLGWRAADPAPVYPPPDWGPALTGNLLIIGLILFFGGRFSSVISRSIRHPQLVGVAIWAAAHLFVSGDDRALIVFGGIGIWAVAEIFALNRRDGAWQRPKLKPLRREMLALGSGLAGYAVLIFAHEFLFGVSPLSG